MTNKNQEAFEQMKRFTKAAKNFYGNNYHPRSVNPQFQTKFFLNEDYIPFDFDTDYDDPLYKEYRRVRMLKNPFDDTQASTPKPQTQQTSVSQPQTNNLQFSTSFTNNNFVPPQPRKPQFNLSNEASYYDLKNHLINQEGNYNHMYLGKIGDLTHCVGHYDETKEETLTHPWVYKKTDIPASREDIIRNRNNILSKPTNYKANWYKKYTDIELPDEYCYKLLDNDVKSRDKELLRGIPNYSKMDNNMKQGLLEPHFTSNILNWPNLRKAATAKDRDWVCSELHRDETGRPDLIDRNKWSYDKCMQGKFIK